MNNFIIVDRSLTEERKVSFGAYFLLTFLLGMCFGDKLECYPSQKYLSEKVGVSVRQIQRYLKELVDAGYIKVKRRGSMSNIYTLVCKKLRQAGEKVAGAIKKAHNAFKGAKKASNFNNFEQRNYDFNKLEKALLGQENFEYEELLE